MQFYISCSRFYHTRCVQMFSWTRNFCPNFRKRCSLGLSFCAFQSTRFFYMCQCFRVQFSSWRIRG